MEKQGITDLKYELAKALTELFVFAGGLWNWGLEHARKHITRVRKMHY